MRAKNKHWDRLAQQTPKKRVPSKDKLQKTINALKSAIIENTARGGVMAQAEASKQRKQLRETQRLLKQYY